MDINKVVLAILRIIVYATLLFITMVMIMYVASGCGKKTAPEPLQYQGRMKKVDEQESGIEIWVDTETGVCYLRGRDLYADTLEVMVDREGRPFIANGWRDYGSEDR